MSLIDALNSIPRNVNPSDYRQDGVLFCGNCHTPKETPVEYLGGKLMPIMCKCAKAADLASKAAQKVAERQSLIQGNIKRGISDRRYLDWTFDNDDMANPRATEIAQRYVEEWPQNKKGNKGLLFVGGVGTGKTFLACCIANALLQKGVSVFITDLPTMLRRATDFDDDVYYDLMRCGLVIIDDIGVERSTEFATEQIYSMINTRYKTGKPMIATTNLNGEEMLNQKDIDKRRIYDRILEMCCTTVVMNGESRRQGIRSKKQKA